MHAKATFVFWITLILYLITLFTVTYVGVYLTYIAIPLIVLSGLIMKCTKPKPEYEEIVNNTKSALKKTGKATNSALEALNSFLDEMNDSLEDYRQKLDKEAHAAKRAKEIKAFNSLMEALPDVGREETKNQNKQ
jgi:hypothetical protein